MSLLKAPGRFYLEQVDNFFRPSVAKADLLFLSALFAPGGVAVDRGTFSADLWAAQERGSSFGPWGRGGERKEGK